MKIIISIFFAFSYSFLFANSSTSEKKIIAIEKEFNIRIYCDYGSHFFPQNFYKKPLSAVATQIQNAEIERLIPYLQKFFSSYPKEVIKNKIDAIYLLRKVNIMQQDLTVFSLGRGMYIADSCGGKLSSDSSIIFGLHNEFSAILFDNYPNVFSDSVWTSKNKSVFFYDDKNLVESLPDDSLYKMGFLSIDGYKELKSDIVSFAVWHFARLGQLQLIEKSYPIIAKKHEQYLAFLSRFKVGKSIVTEAYNKKIVALKKQYGITIHFEYDISGFPDLWCINPYNVQAKQIHDDKIAESLILLEKFLKLYDLELIKHTLKDIYFLEDLKFKRKPYLCLNNLSSLYISSDQIGENAFSEKYLFEMADSYSNIIQTNFSYLISYSDWEKLRQDSSANLNASGFLTEKGKQNSFNDVKDFIALYMLDRGKLDGLATNDVTIRKKTELITSFFKKIRIQLNLVKNISEIIEKKMSNLESKYKVNIIWDFDKNEPRNNYILPPTLRINEKINQLQANRLIGILDSFLYSFPQPFIAQELSNIVLSGSMRFANSSTTIGGTFDNYSKTLYVVNIGNANAYLKGVLHHEFSHLLYQKYSDKFSYKKWITCNPVDFKYNNSGLKPNNDAFETGEFYYKSGFINNYATTKFEDDFAELSNWMFVRKIELKKIASDYKLLQEKCDLIKEFYKQLNEKIEL